MRKCLFVLLLLMAFLGVKAQEQSLKLYMNSGEIKCARLSRIDSLYFDVEQDFLYLQLKDRLDSLSMSAIDSLCYGEAKSYVDIQYKGESAVVENPFAFDSVAVDIEGARVTVTSRRTVKSDYRLSGESGDGEFKIYGVKGYRMTLAGLSLTNGSGPAINSQCKKSGIIHLLENTENSLCDAATYQQVASEDRKGTLFSEGQLIFEGTGKLALKSLYKHAICSDDYIEIHDGNIQVLSAASDAIHANDSVNISGGAVTLSADKDGIDCDGKVTLSGGTLSLLLNGYDVKGIKGAEVNILGGSTVILMDGDISKGIKSAGNFTFSDGTLGITMNGNSQLVDGDPSYATAIKVDSTVVMSGGTIEIAANGIAGRGISADGNISISKGVCTIECKGSYGVYDPSVVTPEEPEEEPVPSYKLYVAKPASTQGGGGRPGGTTSSAWSNIYLYDGNDTQVATLTSSVVINGKTFYAYDFVTAPSGTFYLKSDNYRGGMSTYTIRSANFNAPAADVYYQIASSYSTSGTTRTYQLEDVTASYSDGAASSATLTEKAYAAAAFKCDNYFDFTGGTLNINLSGNASKGINCDGICNITDGIIVMNTSGNAAIVAADPTYCTAIKCGSYNQQGADITITASGTGGIGISSDDKLTIDGGKVNILVAGAGSSYSGIGGTDYYSTKCLKSDGAMNLLGGEIVCSATANGGKCIVSDGVLTIGRSTDDTSYLAISASTTGTALGTSSGGGMGGMGGMQQGFNAAPKAIKGGAEVVINSGRIYTSTKNDGGEGVESKTNMTINGGEIICRTYDDAINAASSLTVNGGYVYCCSTNNDAIDSNGSLYINGGVILASGSTNPEGSFDCDSNTFSITGGIMVGTGGSSSNPTSSQQYYSSVSSVSLTAERYLTVKNSNGETMFSYRCPSTMSSAKVLLSSPEFTSASYTLLYNVTSVDEPQESFLDGVFLIGGNANGGTSKSFTPSKR